MPYFNMKLAKSELATQHSESRATKYIRKISLLVAGVVIGVSGMLEAKNAYSAEEQFFPLLVYRTGPYAPSGIPVANGFRDYYDMLNKRDGGINGVKLTFNPLLSRPSSIKAEFSLTCLRSSTSFSK